MVRVGAPRRPGWLEVRRHVRSRRGRSERRGTHARTTAVRVRVGMAVAAAMTATVAAAVRSRVTLTRRLGLSRALNLNVGGVLRRWTTIPRGRSRIRRIGRRCRRGVSAVSLPPPTVLRPRNARVRVRRRRRRVTRRRRSPCTRVIRVPRRLTGRHCPRSRDG